MERTNAAIEEKWLKIWEDNNLYKVEIDDNKPKYYVLNMFPYPSGAGLHVGHPLGYIATDIYSRYKRMKGFNVLNPMGFDSFGLPAEQYALETGQHPAITTKQNIATFKKQLRTMGFCFDWSREIQTSDPKFYKWTQWIFLQLFNHYYCLGRNKAIPINELIETFSKQGNVETRAACEQKEIFTAKEWNDYSDKEKATILMNYRLAYQSVKEVNWCAALGTVLANDEVKEGLSERGGYPVERRAMNQWSLRITAYADRLLKGLDNLDWNEWLKEMQRNWIGRSEGCEMVFKTESGNDIEIFTTRPDTIYGATFMVLAAEHQLVKNLITEEQQAEMEAYLKYVKSRTDVERQQQKEVTGCFTGSYAINPFTDKKIPIYIAEYVLIDYGTGAIMAVPSDDDRDNAFADKFGIEIIDVIDKSKYPQAGRHDKLGIMINSGFMDGMEVPDAIKAANDKIEAMNIGSVKVNYKLRDAGYSRQRYWGEPFPIIHKNGIATALPESELPLVLPNVDNYKPSPEGKAPISNNKEWTNISETEIRETDVMPGYAGSSWYYLRYMDPQNNDRFVGEAAEKYWQNVDHYAGGAEHAVGHLMYSRMWHFFLYDIGMVHTKEPFKKLFNQGMIQGVTSWIYRKSPTAFVSADIAKQEGITDKVRIPLSMVNGKNVDVEEVKNWRDDFAKASYQKNDNGEFLCTQEVEKMSKSKHNVVNPDEVITKYGADVFRMFEMFLGPVEQSKPWDIKGIDGVRKFYAKFQRLFELEGKWLVNDEEPSDEEFKILHKTIKKIGGDIERYSFNTGVSAFMVATNELTNAKCSKRKILAPLLQLIAPFAPFLADEFWEKLGHKTSIHKSDWPQLDESYLIEATIEYPISINGKMRVKINLPADVQQADAQAVVLENETVQKWIDGKELRKFIFVPGRIVNIVV